MNCARTGCQNAADGVVGIELYPPKSLMEFYRTTRYLTRLIAGLPVCRPCLALIGPFDVMTRKHLEGIARLCSQSSGTSVDLDATKLALVPFDDPDYQRFAEARG